MSDTKVNQDGNVLVIERTFNGPINTVWKAYADKEMFEKWWGPEGWETTTKKFDFREGGSIHYDMHCIDKNQGEWYDQHSWGVMFIEGVDEPNSFSYIDSFTDETGEPNKDMPSLKTNITLMENDGQTTMTIEAIADTAAQVEELMKMGMIEGFNSQMDKLDAILESEN